MKCWMDYKIQRMRRIVVLEYDSTASVLRRRTWSGLTMSDVGHKAA